MTKKTLTVGDLRAALKELPDKLPVELHVMDSETSSKMAGDFEFYTSTKTDHTKKPVLRLYASAVYIGGTS